MLDKILRKQNMTALLICVAGIVFNILLNSVAKVLELPFYFDSSGTVIVAVMGGYLPGIITGFVTNIIKGIFNLDSLYYGVVSVLIAVCAAYMSRRGWLKKIKGILAAAFVFALIGGGIGSLISWFMAAPTSNGEWLSGRLNATGYFNPFISYIISNIIMDLPDKLITMLLAMTVLRIVPEKCYPYSKLTAWMQNPVSMDKMTDTKEQKESIRIMSVRTKLLLALGVSLIVSAVLAIAISMALHNNSIIRERTEVAQGTARIAADVIDGDKVDEYLEKSNDADGYNETEAILGDILSASEIIQYLYVYRIEEDGCHVVFDIDTMEVEGEETGTIIPFDEEFTDYLPELLNGEKIDPIISKDQYGYLLTVYQPVYDSEGRTVCYVGADVDMVQLTMDSRIFLAKIISAFMGFFILICAFVVWLVDYHIIYPVSAITRNVNAFSYLSDSQEELDADLKAFRSIDIHTGDEIEKMYHSLCQMTSNQTEQMRGIRRLSDSTAKMQDGLIITMADMVENRDSDTGAHIQKTAAYVKIIVEGLKEKGYYTEKLTPKFMSDTVRSAPLHDVGKINIPDEVLNKPGKLTDEEFEIMKTHTTAGKRIMERAINTVKGDNYLKEARNMAAYHHERWDGKGYPDGLHGEVIPLSARIMAVADVFDALTSPRIYKPAFPLEKALSIIEEGKGTQFDAKCVEVFMDSLEEVKVILRKYNKSV